MPTRVDIEAATPKCSRLTTKPIGSRPQDMGRRCCEPLVSRGGEWHCPDHGKIEAWSVAAPPIEDDIDTPVGKD